MCGLAGRLERRQDHSGAAVPSLKRKLPAWNLAQAKLGLAGSLKALGKEPARVNTLLKEVLALEGPRHESQRAKARALAGQEASADSKRLHRK